MQSRKHEVRGKVSENPPDARPSSTQASAGSRSIVWGGCKVWLHLRKGSDPEFLGYVDFFFWLRISFFHSAVSRSMHRPKREQTTARMLSNAYSGRGSLPASVVIFCILLLHSQCALVDNTAGLEKTRMYPAIRGSARPRILALRGGAMDVKMHGRMDISVDPSRPAGSLLSHEMDGGHGR
jgi:hypothetical protein